jgi:hypothetical protein
VARQRRYRRRRPGDATLRAKLFFLQAGRDTARHLVAFTAGVKAPTALRRAEGQPVGLEPGTGSIDPELGLSYGFFAYPWSGHASVAVLRPMGGWDDSEPAAALRGSAVVQYQPMWVVAVGLGVDARFDGKARAATTAAGALTGFAALPRPHEAHDIDPTIGRGAILMVSPTAAAQVGPDLNLMATVRVPVWRDLPAGHGEGVTVALAIVKDV